MFVIVACLKADYLARFNLLVFWLNLEWLGVDGVTIDDDESNNERERD